MTVPGQYLLQNSFTGQVGQAIFGPPGLRGGAYGATTNLLVPAAEVQEVSAAGPVPASLATVPVGTPVAAWLSGAAGVAEIIPYARVSAPGVVKLATGNLTALAATFGPAAPQVQAYSGLMRHQLVLQGAILQGSAVLAALPSPGAVATRQQLETGAFAIANGGTLLVMNPTAALPAGFMAGYVRPDAFSANVALANLTAAPADPGVTNWNIHTVAFGNSTSDGIPSGQNGPIAVSIASGITVSFGVIAGATVLEASAALPGLDPGDGIIVCPRSVLPEAKMAPSHSRCAVSGTLIWGMANLDPAVATAAADIVCDVAILKPLPIF